MEVIFELYPIVDGCATECVFFGTFSECKDFASRQLKVNPDFDFILL